jgi:energy-coupling factor transporter ATP-binding protein EcfA2
LFDDFNICPYTGLRSFTEEESIYFKGRDEHIQQATAQLEQNKFLMLTGASGDGKSSIVYAGIIPNARAGFLKATYSNWYVADFRPERTPFQNLCRKIAKALQIDNTAIVESELQHGFSALVDLYKSSPLYIDTSTNEYQQASDEERRKMQQSSANLLILVDQFEEFFTNPENYVSGVPSNEATLTMNLLLETARIALDEGLPIYIVFTMRSDFIGQCAAFRELPEYIGFSQFFVPRLNRKLLQEVIEEPSILSGNKITRRLTERIIHDMTDGVDQLPILQHALNQIWKAATDGKEEMDLIHYAMVGGLDPKELPAEDQVKFSAWFEALPAKVQSCYHNRSLHNVLDTHANKIYEEAAAYLKEKTGKSISEGLSHEIIKTTFTSLTKIDQSREVRNRMTLEEIKNIINNPQADLETISGIINLFREPGNTFVRPFILEDPTTHELNADSVLDITHESLIRNWSMLGTWTKEEYDKFTVFKDFKQQVDRWLQHGKSGGFLLPIGSLTFFESWYADARINKYWVNRYNEQVTDTPKNIEESDHIVQDCNDFLAKSAKKHLVTRAIVKFGPRRVAALVAAVLLLGLSSFYYYDYRKRTNEYVLAKLTVDATKLLNGDKAANNTKADYVIYQERVEKGNFTQILNNLDTDKNRLEIAVAAAEDLVLYDRQGSLSLKKQAIIYADSLASIVYKTTPQVPKVQNEALLTLLSLAETCENYLHYYEDDEIANVQLNTGKILAGLTLYLVEHPFANLNMQKFDESVDMGLNHNSFSSEQINKLISVIANTEAKIQTNFARDNLVGTDRTPDAYSFAGKYFILAELNAALGNVEASLAAIDTNFVYSPRSEEYSTNALSVAGYFARYNHWQALDDFVSGYAKRTNAKAYEIYRQIANRTGYINQTMDNRVTYLLFNTTSDMWYNPVLDLMPQNSIDKLYKAYLQAIKTTTNSRDELNYNLAVYYKQKGIFKAKRKQNKQISPEFWLADVNVDFDRSILNFRQTSDQYLNEGINVHFHLPTVMSRRRVYTFPDYIEHVPSHATRTRYSNYLSSVFIEYLINKKLVTAIYPTATELQQVITWVREYKNSLYYYGFNYDANSTDFIVLQKLDSAIFSHPAGKTVNSNMLMLLMADKLFETKQNELAIDYARRINPVALPDLFSEEDDLAHDKTISLVGRVHAGLITQKEKSLAYQIRASFPEVLNRIRLLDVTAAELFIEGMEDEGNQYLDSANRLITTLTDFGSSFQNFRKTHGYAIALSSNDEAFRKSKSVIRNLDDFWHNMAYTLDVRATGFHQQYYTANSELPKFYSSEEQFNTINQIFYSMSYYRDDSLWSAYDFRKNYAYLSLHYE